MNFNDFKKETISEHGQTISDLLTYFFENTVILAANNDENTLKVAEIIRNLLPFSDLKNSEKIYIVGFLGDIYINNNMLDEAEKSFKIGMNIIKNTNKEEFEVKNDLEVLKYLQQRIPITEEDVLKIIDKDIIDNFLDLKLRIDKKKKQVI